ncbi:MAG: DUF2459 domain-containing protein [Arenicellales bacterium]
MSPLKLILRCSFLIVISVLTACVSVEKGLYPAPKDAPDNHTIFLTYGKNHTGITLKMADTLGELDDIQHAFPDAPYINFSWGDRNWYGGGSKNAFVSSYTLLVPTKTALHLAGLKKSPDKLFKNPKHYSKLELSAKGYQRLIHYIHRSFARDANGNTQQIHQGKTKRTVFKVYAAKGKYHMLNNSNSWSSQALAQAGVSRSMLQLATGFIDL